MKSPTSTSDGLAFCGLVSAGSLHLLFSRVSSFGCGVSVRWTGSVRFLPLMRVSSDSGSGFKSPLYDWFDRQYHESKGDVGSSGDCSTSTSDASLCLFCFTTPIIKFFALLDYDSNTAKLSESHLRAVYSERLKICSAGLRTLEPNHRKTTSRRLG